MANERTNRKAALAALGVTTGGAAQNETTYNKALINGLSGIATKNKSQIAALTPTAVANASDLATAQALANDLKVKVNAIIAALKA